MSQIPPNDPARLVVAREAVLQSMRKRHTVTGKDAWLLVASGAVVLFILGWFVALLMMVLHAFVVGYHDAWHVHTYFLLYLVMILVWLFFHERATRGSFFSFSSSDVDLRRDPDNSAEYVIQRGKTHLSTLIEYLMWAPRALIAGYRGLRGIRSTALDAILPEAADTMTRMLAIDKGVKIVELAPAGTEPMQLMPILKWLDTHDYIGFSTQGDKVWISSPAKKRFAEDGVTIPRAQARVVAGPAVLPSRPASSDDSGPIDLAE